MKRMRIIRVIVLTMMVTLLSFIASYGQPYYDSGRAIPTIGVDIANSTGELNNDTRGGIKGDTIKAAVNFGSSDTPAVFHVQFASLLAVTRGGILFVNWSTTAERNNESFEIEVSADGVNFTTIGIMDSKAEKGDPNSTLSYEFTVDLSGVTIASSGVAVALLVLGGLTMGLPRKKRWVFAGIMLSGLLLGVASCRIKSIEPVSENTSACIRIAQIDQNGSKTYSEIVKVVDNN